MPSLHTAWALSLFIHSRRGPRWLRLGGAFWLFCTLTATLGLGAHYGIDLIVRSSAMKIPTLEIEAVLLRHPKVSEVVLVGYPDEKVPGTELVCAVVVADGEPPTLRELHDHLDGERVAPILWPDRVQFVWQLPKNSLGKVLRQPLRERLEIAQAPR